MTAQPSEIHENASTALARAVTDLDMADAATLRAAFESMFANADEWVMRARQIRVTDESQKREMKLARESRLALREIRINVEKKRKQLKEDSLRRGRAIDGLANVIKGLIEPIEDYLSEQESFGERAQKAREDALREARTTALRALGANPAAHADLGAMPDDVWESVRSDAELAKQAREEAARREEEVRQEAERIAAQRREEERQAAVKAEAERVERERRLQEEAEQLRAQIEQANVAAEEERQRVERERADERRKAQADAEARELEARAAREKAQIEADARVAAEARLDAERERVAREQREREQAEAQAAAEAAAAPDREKLLSLAETVRAIRVADMSTTRGKQIAISVVARLAKLAQQIEEAADTIASAGQEAK